MPTADRAEWVQQAVRCFQRQDYPQRELVIVDDGARSVAGLLPTDSRIRYHRTEPGRSLGAKRNLACELARGEILCHWDDDDWHAPWRLRYQVRSLLAAEADVCGLDRLLFYEPAAGRLWRYVHPQGQAPWLAGGTFCYRRTLWQRCPFPDLDIGEDNAFLTHAGRPGRVLALDDPRFYLARIHPGNTSPKNPVGRRWQSLDPGELAGILEDDLLRKDLR